MGIRIQKVIGWVKLYPNDEFKKTFPNYDKDINKIYSLKGKDFYDYLTSVYGDDKKKWDYDNTPMDLMLWMDTDTKTDLYNCIISIDEGLDPIYDDYTLVIFTPIREVNEWHRSDDTIDYVESLQKSLNQGEKSQDIETEIMFLSTPPSPYEGQWMNQKTGVTIPPRKLQTLKFIKDIHKLGMEQPADPEKVSEVLSSYGFESVEDLTENLVPAIPEGLRIMLTDWLKLVTPEELNTYKPALVTYWN